MLINGLFIKIKIRECFYSTKIELEEKNNLIKSLFPVATFINNRSARKVNKKFGAVD